MSLVCEQIKTAAVTFEAFGKTYTYMTVIEDLSPGDEVIVETGEAGTLKIATVAEVHEEPDLDPQARYQYRWILSVAGTTARSEQTRLHALENQVTTILKKAEKANRRKKLAEDLKAVFGDSLDSVKAIDLKTAEPATGEDPLS
jgi:hypothetical protein